MITLPAAMAAAMRAMSANEALLAFVTITHADFATMRYNSDTVAHTRGGVSYPALGAEATLPPEQNGRAGDSTLVLDGVDLAVITALRTASPLNGPPLVNIVVALASAPDNGVDFGTFEARKASGNEHTVELSLTYGDESGRMLPGDMMTSVNYPGVFR